MSGQRAVIGVDIGGTKIKSGAVAVDSGATGDRVIIADEVPTPRQTPAEFYDALWARRVAARLRHPAAIAR